MISEHLAVALRDAGLRWNPEAGDRFVIPGRDLDGELFTLSEMTIEAREYPTGTILGFNGTTEWALDSVAQEDTLWMPREDQLRGLLGAAFLALSVVRDGDEVAHVVTTRSASGAEIAHRAADAADAYGLALLGLIEAAIEDAPLPT